ncbi:hypothetical protein E2N92_04870 [Methanofollis formosanus]|uniref:Uncharacterized protein n=1 Tax=Methanofollis formosanus TaxID=299308 RepID=A0A8G1EFI6_9EURY|nr:hypothetical protein [Methanofollis formosanus]QYZ78808.1 hypothetical protein E2N92_04870 [Methanofollis formosanus]
MRATTYLLAAVLVISLATPVFAAEIDLVVDKGASLSWNEEGIKPGEEGETVVTLRNAGSRPGTLSLWVSGLTESDGGGDGAALGRYLFFTLSGERLESGVTFPANLAAFPHGPDDRNTIGISRLDAGESVNLTWHWEFQEIYKPQNDAQGDAISFEVTYLLTEIPGPPSPPGPGGGGGVNPLPSLPVEEDDRPENESWEEDRPTVSPTPGSLPPSTTRGRGPMFHWIPALLGIALLAYSHNRASSRGMLPQGSERETLVGMLMVLAGAGVAVAEVGYPGQTGPGGYYHALAGTLAAAMVSLVIASYYTDRGRLWRLRRSELYPHRTVRTITLLLLITLLTGVLIVLTGWVAPVLTP